MTVQVRCSELDRVMACAGSLVKSRAPFNPNSEMANLGRAGHEVCESVPFGHAVDLVDVAERYGIEEKDLGILYAYARRAWAHLGLLFPNPSAEHRLEGVQTKLWRLQGTTDLISTTYSEEGELLTLAVWDWKTGYSHDQHPFQLMGYADCARAAFGMPASGYIGAIEVHLRHEEFEVQKFSQADLDGFRARLDEQVRNKRQFAPGLHCKFCPRSLQCDARSRWLRAAGSALEQVPKGEISPTELVQLYPKAEMLKKALKQYDDLLSEALESGPIDIGDGRRMIFEEKEQESIDYAGAEEMLWELEPEQRALALSVSKSKFLDAIASSAPPRKGAAYKREAMERLRRCNAIVTKKRKSKRIIKIPTDTKVGI